MLGSEVHLLRGRTHQNRHGVGARDTQAPTQPHWAVQQFGPCGGKPNTERIRETVRDWKKGSKFRDVLRNLISWWEGLGLSD